MTEQPSLISTWSIMRIFAPQYILRVHWPCRIWLVQMGYPSWLRRPSLSPKPLSWTLKTAPTWVCAFEVSLRMMINRSKSDFYLTLRRGKNQPSWQQGTPIRLSKFQHVPLWKGGSRYNFPPPKKGQWTDLSVQTNHPLKVCHNRRWFWELSQQHIYDDHGL